VIFRKADGSEVTVNAVSRLDTGSEVEYYRNGGILHYVMRKMMTDAA
jgi:aconitate hydratase